MCAPLHLEDFSATALYLKNVFSYLVITTVLHSVVTYILDYINNGVPYPDVRFHQNMLNCFRNNEKV